MKSYRILFILLGFLQFIQPHECYSQETDIEQIILRSDETSLNQWVTKNDINGFYASRKYTPLIYSIVFNKPEIVKKLIIAGAKIEKGCETKSPLLFALEYNRTEIARILIHKGASVKVKDSLDNTPLFYAASFDNLPIMRLLIRKGVPIMVKNKLKITARNYAVLCNKQKAAKFLKFYFEKHLPNYCDGPYVTVKKNKFRIYYLLHDSIKHQSDVVNMNEYNRDSVFSFKGFVTDTNRYTLSRYPQPEPDQYPLDSKIFVMGDVHGDYFGMIDILQKAGVIDRKLNWKWGSGHLVFLGDIVDRGDNVTECLWLINKLEQQARMKGGYVHYLLGNHEIMIMTKDYRYLADKYFYMNDKLKIDFSEHYDQNSYFGKWLGSKNAIIKIGPYLFLHAGLAYDSFLRRYSISDMNTSLRKYIKHPYSYPFTDTINWLLSDDGPLWYRGYNAQFDSAALIKSYQLDSVMKYYNTSKIFIGHTHTREISSAFNGRVVLMDVPYYLDEADPAAIKIESGRVYIFSANNSSQLELKE